MAPKQKVTSKGKKAPTAEQIRKKLDDDQKEAKMKGIFSRLEREEEEEEEEEEDQSSNSNSKRKTMESSYEGASEVTNNEKRPAAPETPVQSQHQPEVSLFLDGSSS